MTTPILGIAEVSDGQINQYVTYNNALRSLESAGNNFLSVSLASGNVTLTAAEFNGYFLFSSAGNSVARSITVPASKRLFSVYNGGSFDLSVIRGSSTQLIAPASSALFYTDGAANTIYKIGGSGAGGLTWFSSSKNSAAPNASVPVVIISPDDTPANIDIALRPKGQGSFFLQVPDSTATGGNKRGNWSVDLQLYRTSAAQVASGSISFAAGANSTASGGYSTAIQGGTASGSRSVAIGQGSAASADDAVAVGATCTSAGAGSWAIGSRASTSTRQGVLAFASGMFAVGGDSQSIRSVLRRQTTDGVASDLTADGSFGGSQNQMTLQNSSALVFRGLAVARQNSTGDAAGWEFSGVLFRGANAASTTLVAAVTPVLIGASAGAAAWALSVTADTTSGALRVSATGEAAKTIKWVCTLDCAEVVA